MGIRGVSCPARTGVGWGRDSRGKLWFAREAVQELLVECLKGLAARGKAIGKALPKMAKAANALQL
jgi:hypothetical protein